MVGTAKIMQVGERVFMVEFYYLGRHTKLAEKRHFINQREAEIAARYWETHGTLEGLTLEK